MVIGALALAAAYLFIAREHPAPVPAPGIDTLVARPSVIVLPFSNISGDEAQDYLAFGTTDELIVGLQRLGNFPIVSRNAHIETPLLPFKNRTCILYIPRMPLCCLL